MKINYDLKLKEELEKIKGTKPTLLLHVCCGPCSGNVLKEISEFFDITIYYSNSNIYPDTEYFRRFHELENFIQCFNQDFNQNIQVVEKEYQPKEYLKDISQYRRVRHHPLALGKEELSETRKGGFFTKAERVII